MGEVNTRPVDCGCLSAHVADEKFVIILAGANDADVVSLTYMELVLGSGMSVRRLVN